MSGLVSSLVGFLRNLLRLPKRKKFKPELSPEVKFEHERTRGVKGF